MADSENNQDPTDLNIPVGHDELVIRNRYETLSTANDFLIGVMFVVGSVLFLSESTSTVGTWFFIVGSVQLLIRPSIRLARRIHLQRFDTPDRTDHGGDYRCFRIADRASAMNHKKITARSSLPLPHRYRVLAR